MAGKRAGSFSLGMGQRLGIAAALLADPAVLILDEPVNGPDPEGVLWVRNLLRTLASEGRTVLLSSHLMSEMAQTADHLVIVGRGRLLADTTVERFVGLLAGLSCGPLGDRTAGAVRAVPEAPDTLRVTGTDAAHIGRTAAAHGIPLHELTPHSASLEDAFMDLTRETVEYEGRVAAV